MTQLVSSVIHWFVHRLVRSDLLCRAHRDDIAHFRVAVDVWKVYIAAITRLNVSMTVTSPEFSPEGTALHMR